LSRNVIFFLAAAAIFFPSGAVFADTLNVPSPRVISFSGENDFSDVLSESKKEPERTPEDFLNQAVIYKDLDQYSRAVRVLRRALKENPGDAGVLSFLGRIYYLMGLPARAVHILEKALELESGNASIHRNLALSYEEMGKLRQAIERYEKCLVFSPRDVVAHRRLADLFAKRGHHERAIRHYRDVLVSDPSLAQEIYPRLAKVYFDTGDFESCREIYKKLLLMRPGDRSISEKIHFVESKLGRAYLDSKEEKRLRERSVKTVLVKPVDLGERPLMIRVGLVRNARSVELKCSGFFRLRSAEGRVIADKRLGQETYRVTPGPGKGIIVTHAANPSRSEDFLEEMVIVEPAVPGSAVTLFNVKFGENSFWANEQDRSYRGRVEIRATPEGLTVINVLPLEEYLISVIPSEMPASWPEEALKAQTVAARSEALHKMGRHAKEGFDLCAEVHCQAYRGIEQETAATTAAVHQTRGMIMVHGNKPVDAVYSSSCGGHTQDNIFGNASMIPYLKGVPDVLVPERYKFPLSPVQFEKWLEEPGEGILCDIPTLSRRSQFRWVRIYEADELSDLVDPSAAIGRLRRIVVSKRGVSGHASAVELIGEKASLKVEKELNIRKTLGGLRSGLFKIEVLYGPGRKPRRFIFIGGGWGHGVGMCQSGAAGMALHGWDFKTILSHYYQGVEIRQWPLNG
jgi:SpoIID/LytB domain protein